VSRADLVLPRGATRGSRDVVVPGHEVSSESSSVWHWRNSDALNCVLHGPGGLSVRIEQVDLPGNTEHATCHGVSADEIVQIVMLDNPASTRTSRRPGEGHDEP
jgi:hypothetical protein